MDIKSIDLVVIVKLGVIRNIVIVKKYLEIAVLFVDVKIA